MLAPAVASGDHGVLKPLLIKVDGPLNPYAALSGHRPPPGYTRHRMRPTGWTAGPALPVLLDPAHGARLLALVGRYELVRATTWKDEANEWIGPRIGLPRLPFIDWPQMHGPAPEGTYRKTRYVVAYAAGPPFASIGDEISDRDREWVAGRPPAGDSLLRWIDPAVGLAPTDFDALAAWADGREDKA